MELTMLRWGLAGGLLVLTLGAWLQWLARQDVPPAPGAPPMFEVPAHLVWDLLAEARRITEESA